MYNIFIQQQRFPCIIYGHLDAKARSARQVVRHGSRFSYRMLTGSLRTVPRFLAKRTPEVGLPFSFSKECLLFLLLIVRVSPGLR